MNIKKTHLSQLPMVYAVTAFRRHDGLHFLAATELYGQWHYFAPQDYRPRIVSHTPGGVLGFAPTPGGQGRFFAIEQAYPIYNFSQAVITLVGPGTEVDGLWTKRPAANLPFVHRIGLLPVKDGHFLVAGTMCGPKAHQEDWSVPGAVFVSAVSADGAAPLSFVKIYEGLSRNHGMQIAPFQGTATLFVSGIEGLFAFNHVRQGSSDSWHRRQLLATDVSDVAVFDLDGDGVEEIITIEPFHGEIVGIYRQTSAGLVLAARHSVAFGHVAWAGIIRGRRCLLLGSRAGRKDLRLLVFRGDGTLDFESITLDEGGGPANVAVIQESDRDVILCANHVRGEVALYEIRD